ncbi:hypothetical protein SAMN05216251_102252 [Actinacidiphila alni]|uniref:Peptidase n=1 Tax=Actinacidiphila alni TaxID=380248 RepID=A0A1I1Z2U1_9ACTN|nr:hypothetical protein [Actinacidiphila alni]SFE24650.1 hypothetical protein SAMN05216251_102252 [Actinacidiphila alni]
MKRQLTFTAAAAVLALAALQGHAAADSTPSPSGSGPAGSAPAEAPPATWPPSGTAIAGASTTADAPPMEPATTYKDTIKPDETRIYGVTLDAKSSAYVSAYALPPAGSRVTYGDGIELKLQSADGSDCDSRDETFDTDGAARPIGSAVARLMGVDSDCQEANQYTLSVHRKSAATSDPGAWPLELRFVLEPALKPGTTAQPAPNFGSASPTPLTAGTPRQAHGGTSFTTAAAVRTGIWKDRVLPGETRFYKVPVDWGQQATVFSDFSSAPVNGDQSTYVSGGVRLTSYSPVRELIDSSDNAYSGSPTSLNERLAPVSYANRAASDSDVVRVRYAGWYYFAVSVHPDVAHAVTGAVPVTLRVDVKGTAQAAPAYDGDPGTAGIGIDAHDVSAADGSPTDGAGSSSGTSGMRFLAFAALGAGTVLLLTLAVWYAAARRRAGRPVDAVPQQVGAQQSGSQQAGSQQSGYGPPPAW